MSDKLAINGGNPVRNTSKSPWHGWPLATDEEWQQRIEPVFKEVYLSRTEGLPGPKAAAFGKAFGEYCGTDYAICMPHGTDAIGAAVTGVLDLDGFGDGGEVIIPNYTFVATASAVLDRRCRVVFVDIDPDTGTIDPQAVEEAIGPETAAILPVHLLGHPAHMGPLMQIAEKHGLKVVEDAAQAHGAEYQGKKVGSLGHAGAFSFQSSKNLTSGEGGAVTTDDKDVYDRVFAFSNVGRRPGGARWEYPRLGWNYRPSEYLAALIVVRLELLEEQTVRRNRNADYLSKQVSAIEGISPPKKADWATKHAYHLYPMKYDPEGFGGHPRGEFLSALSAEGIPCTGGYGGPLSNEGGLARVAELYPELIRVLPCPNVEKVCQESVWLFQNMLLGTTQDMDDIIAAIAKIQHVFSS